MNSRERALAAISHGRPDRCPVDFSCVPEVESRLLDFFHIDSEDRLLDILEVDFQCVRPDLIPSVLRHNSDGTYFDHLGIHRRIVKNSFGAYEEFASSPLGFAETVEELDDYKYWPTTDAFDWSDFSQRAKDAFAKRVTRIVPGGIFETAWALRGFEQFMLDMVLDPDLAMEILRRICAYCEDYIIKSMEVAGDFIDVVMLYDDIAAQNSLLMSAGMLREFIFVWHHKLCELAHSYGKKVIYHSCGAVKPIVEDLIALPIDVLDPMQPVEGMDFSEFQRLFGSRLAFRGGISLQTTLPLGTPDEVRQAVRSAVGALSPNYILCAAHSLQNDIPTENILALYDPEIRKY